MRGGAVGTLASVGFISLEITEKKIGELVNW